MRQEIVDQASGLVLYAPLQVPKAIAPNVWVIDSGVIWMAFPGFSAGLRLGLARGAGARGHAGYRSAV